MVAIGRALCNTSLGKQSCKGPLWPDQLEVLLLNFLYMHVTYV